MTAEAFCYRRILAAVNEHSNSELAARYALSLAQACGARLSLVFVAQDRVTPEALHRAEASLERLFTEAAERSLEVESIVQRGRPLDRIRELVAERGIDLVFAATRREDVARRYFTRTQARELMLHLPCSVALVRLVHPGRVHPRRILVPFRGHLTRLEERGHFVARLAQVFGAQVTLFHAPRSLTGFFHGELHLRPAEREAFVPEDMEKFIRSLQHHQVAHDRRLGHGRVGAAIAVEAALRRSDLIVMGASERGLLRSLLSGNPVEEVLQESPCNLIIFMPRLDRS
ncbi:MAG: universal stress protein [Deltaproteobacteria bacterium]|nr:universal stress protein [Deltaproteobacteria bacterium]